MRDNSIPGNCRRPTPVEIQLWQYDMDKRIRTVNGLPVVCWGEETPLEPSPPFGCTFDCFRSNEEYSPFDKCRGYLDFYANSEINGWCDKYGILHFTNRAGDAAGYYDFASQKCLSNYPYYMLFAENTDYFFYYIKSTCDPERQCCLDPVFAP